MWFKLLHCIVQVESGIGIRGILSQQKPGQLPVVLSAHLLSKEQASRLENPPYLWDAERFMTIDDHVEHSALERQLLILLYRSDLDTISRELLLAKLHIRQIRFRRI